jgi:hypothetical protein
VNHELTPEDAALIAGETAEKVKRETGHSGYEFASVVSVSYDEGLNTYVEVSMANSDRTIRIPSLFGRRFQRGQRVAIVWVPPAGCYVIGTPEMFINPVARMSLGCETVKGGGEG